MTFLFSCEWEKSIILKISLEELVGGGGVGRAGRVAVSTSCRIPEVSPIRIKS